MCSLVISMHPSTPTHTHTPPARSLVSEVYRVGPTLKLVLLECDASFPSDLAHTTLHPMIVYIQIARQKVCEGGGEGGQWLHV